VKKIIPNNLTSDYAVTATRLWAPGLAHETHGIARRPPQHPNPQLYNIPHSLTHYIRPILSSSSTNFIATQVLNKTSGPL